MSNNEMSRELLEKYFDVAFSAPEGIKKLRELILTLAMQGKLVPQDLHDQPASELLKEIEGEKRRLVKVGKIKVPKPLPEIKPEEGPYALPVGWEWVRLGQVTDYNGRKNIASEEIAADTWLLDLEDIEKDTSRIIYRAKYSERLSTSTKSTFQKGDILYGKLRPYLNKVVVADTDGVCTTEIIPIVPSSAIDSQFLRWLLKRPAFLTHVDSLMYGVKMPRLGTDDAVKSVHPLPPLAEQKRIVARIDQLMARCDELEKLRAEREAKRLTVHISALNRLFEAQGRDSFTDAWQFINRHFGELYSVKANVTELRKAILQLGVMGKLVSQDPTDQPASELLKEIEAEKRRLVKTGKIREPKLVPEIKPEEVPYEIPKGWIWVRLNDVFDVRDGTHDTPKYVDVGYPLITSKNLYTGRLDFEDVKYISEADHLKIIERSKVDLGDILFAMIGSIGNPVIVDRIQEFSIKNVALFKFYNASIPDNRFLHYFLLNVQSSMKEKSSGAVQSFVSLGFLRQYLFPLPPLGEQHRIVAKIEQLMALCDQLEQQIEATASKQSALLKAVMSKM